LPEQRLTKPRSGGIRFLRPLLELPFDALKVLEALISVTPAPSLVSEKLPIIHSACSDHLALFRP
jgi:hypothetical protein